MIFIHKTILAYKLETFENCKEVMHIIIIIIAIIYISNRKLLSENPQVPPEKIHSPHFTHSILLTPPPLKFQKVQVPSFLPTLKFLMAHCVQNVGKKPWLNSIQIFQQKMIKSPENPETPLQKLTISFPRSPLSHQKKMFKFPHCKFVKSRLTSSSTSWG